MLAVAVVYFWKRDQKSEASLVARESAAQARCDTERQTMTAKIERLEDRIASLYEDTIRNSTAALESNVIALERFCESATVTPPRPHQAIKDTRP